MRVFSRILLAFNAIGWILGAKCGAQAHFCGFCIAEGQWRLRTRNQDGSSIKNQDEKEPGLEAAEKRPNSRELLG